MINPNVSLRKVDQMAQAAVSFPPVKMAVNFIGHVWASMKNLMEVSREINDINNLAKNNFEKLKNSPDPELDMIVLKSRIKTFTDKKYMGKVYSLFLNKAQINVNKKELEVNKMQLTKLHGQLSEKINNYTKEKEKLTNKLTEIRTQKEKNNRTMESLTPILANLKERLDEAREQASAAEKAKGVMEQSFLKFTNANTEYAEAVQKHTDLYNEGGSPLAQSAASDNVKTKRAERNQFQAEYEANQAKYNALKEKLNPNDPIEEDYKNTSATIEACKQSNEDLVKLKASTKAQISNLDKEFQKETQGLENAMKVYK